MLKRAFESLRFQVVLDADRIYRQKKHDSRNNRNRQKFKISESYIIYSAQTA